MKNSVKVAFCGMLCALSTAFLWLSYFPYFTYAVPAISGLVMLIVLIEIDAKWAVGTYIATSVLAMLFAEPEARLMFVLFLGYYPILKSAIEKIRQKIFQYILKFTVFNGAVFLIYGLLANVFGIYMGDIEGRGILVILALLVLANVTFYLYDIVLVRVADIYLLRLHHRIAKMLKRK